jgi:hypothetical protein
MAQATSQAAKNARTLTNEFTKVLTPSAHTQALFFRAQGLDARYYTGERWTSQLIAFFWTQGHTLWKDRCVFAHAPATENFFTPTSLAPALDGQHTTAWKWHAHTAPLMLALDRRIFDIPSEERFESRTTDLVA